ncbi:MAG: substrate-binding domain-containing protein [Pseudomonadota bacterium]
MDQTPTYLTTREVADLLRVKERKVYDLAAEGEIPHRRITGKLLFPQEELRAWIEGAPEPPRDRPALLTGSHDPLLDWALRASGASLGTLICGSREGLERFQRAEAAVTGLHLRSGDAWNIPDVEALGTQDAVLIAWARRSRGLMLRKSLTGVDSLGDLKGRRLALRQEGSGTARLLDELMRAAGLVPQDFDEAPETARTESDAAAAVAAGEADAALGLQSMASRFGLRFLPLLDETFDLLIDRRAYFTAPVQTLFSFCRTQAFQDKAITMGGYDTRTLGQVRWLSP